MFVVPHKRGWAVVEWAGKSMGWRTLHTFTSLMAARSWLYDRT